MLGRQVVLCDRVGFVILVDVVYRKTAGWWLWSGPRSIPACMSLRTHEGRSSPATVLRNRYDYY